MIIYFKFQRKIGNTKIILRGNLDHIKICNPHKIINKYQYTSIEKLNNQLITKVFYNNNYYYDHFFFKSSEEYLDTLMRGDAIFDVKKGYAFRWFQIYFSINKITNEKLNYFENKTGLNISAFRNKVIK